MTIPNQSSEAEHIKTLNRRAYRFLFRRKRISRLIIGALAPVPIASAAVCIALFQTGYSIIALPFCYVFLIYMGYMLVGIQSIVYSLLMEFVVSNIPIIKSNIILYILFSAALLGLCFTILCLDIDFSENILLQLGLFTGAVMGLILYPLNKLKIHTEDSKPDQSIDHP